MVLFLLCLKIFFARILDVSIGTVRTVLIVKGKTILATITAFIEVFIWFMIAREALNTDLDSIWIPFSYAGGFAAGTLIGSLLSEKFINGIIGVQVITMKPSDTIVTEIRNHNLAVSIIPLKKEEEHPDKEMLFIQLNKSKLKGLIKLLNKLDPKAFVVINETKNVQNGFIK